MEYEKGDAVVEQFGFIKLEDGREFNGVLLTFPVEPPHLPLSAVWDGTPIVLAIRGGVLDTRPRQLDATPVSSTQPQ